MKAMMKNVDGLSSTRPAPLGDDADAGDGGDADDDDADDENDDDNDTFQRCGQAIRAMSRMTGMMRRSR